MIRALHRSMNRKRNIPRAEGYPPRDRQPALARARARAREGAIPGLRLPPTETDRAIVRDRMPDIEKWKGAAMSNSRIAQRLRVRV